MVAMASRDGAVFALGAEPAYGLSRRWLVPKVAVFAAGLGLNLLGPGLWAPALSASAALVLLVANRSPTGARWWLVAAPFLSGGLAVGLTQAFTGESAAVQRAALRSVAGAAWAVWFSAGLSFVTLRRALAGLGLSAALLEALDLAFLHAASLGLLLRRRAEAALVRIGRKETRAPITSAQVLAGAVVRAVIRADSLLETRLLRSGGPASAAAGEPIPQGASSLAVLERVSLPGSPGRDVPPRLNAVDLRIEAGAWIAVAGPSGAGKTSLLRVLAGLECPAQGRFERFGQLVTAVHPGKRVDARVALVFQDPDDQFFAATALDDLVWGLKSRDLVGPAAEDKARRALAALGIEHLADRSLASLSFGEKKRVAFAGALVTEPALLLCDEPTMGLDPVAAEVLSEALLGAIAGKPTAVVWVTHDLDRLPQPVRRVVLLRAGRVVFDGEREQGLDARRLCEAGLRRGP
jgi:cobalt/nickel transport system ATP-binding protein